MPALLARVVEISTASDSRLTDPVTGSFAPFRASVNAARMLGNPARFFDAGNPVIIAEPAQNARRAGARHLW